MHIHSVTVSLPIWFCASWVCIWLVVEHAATMAHFYVTSKYFIFISANVLLSVPVITFDVWWSRIVKWLAVYSVPSCLRFHTANHKNVCFQPFLA